MWVSLAKQGFCDAKLGERGLSLPNKTLLKGRESQTHVLGPADSGGVDEATLQVAVPEEAVVRLHARESVQASQQLAVEVTAGARRSG